MLGGSVHPGDTRQRGRGGTHQGAGMHQPRGARQGRARLVAFINNTKQNNIKQGKINQIKLQYQIIKHKVCSKYNIQSPKVISHSNY